MNIITVLVLITLTLIVCLVLYLVIKAKKKLSIRPKAEIIEIGNKKTMNRTFIFNFTVIDPNKFISRPFKGKITLKDIELFLNSKLINSSTQRSYISPINEDLIRLNTNINYISLDKNNSDSIVNSNDELSQHFYEIKNKYYLMDPFLTSGRENEITNKMKLNFELVLDKKSKLIDTKYQDYQL
jgi:hypothetical protein